MINKIVRRMWKPLVLGLLVALVVTLSPLGIQFNSPPQDVGSPSFEIGQHQFVLTIGTDVLAAGVADYTCDGVDDNIQFQLALDALPAGGGKLVALTGDYSFSATVSRAIDDVTFDGMGDSTYFAYDGGTALFDAGTQDGWVFRNFRTDAGGVDVGSTEDYVITNVTVGTVVVGKITRTATFIVAASDSSASSKAQADWVCSGADDQVEIQVAIDALPAGGSSIVLSEGTFDIAAALVPASGLYLKGSGVNTILSSSANTPIISIDGRQDVLIESMKLDGNQVGLVAGCRLISIENNSRITIRDIVGVDAKEDGIYIGAHDTPSDHILVENVKFSGGARWGVAITAGSEITIRKAELSANTLGGLVVEPNSITDVIRDITLNDIDCHNATSGITIMFVIGSTVQYGVLLDDIKCHDGAGITIKDAISVTVVNSKVYAITGSGIIIKNAMGVTIINSTVHSTTGEGISLERDVKDISILNNNIYNNALRGIALTMLSETIDSSKILIQGNIIYDHPTASYDGIRVAEGVKLIKYLQIVDNIIYNNRFGVSWGDGTYTGVVFERNQLSGNVSGATFNAPGARNNIGWKTENSGTATVLNTTTSIVVAHELAATPTRIQITPRENPTNAVSFWWVDTVGTTNFTINVNADPGASNLDFDWRAQVGEGN